MIALLSPAIAKPKSIRPYYPGAVLHPAAQADVVLVGKVVAVDAEFTQARPFPSGGAGQTVGWMTATIKVTDGLLGAKGKTHVRFGWMPGQAYGTPVVYEKVAVLREGGSYGGAGAPITLSEGQEACLILTMHPDGDFYVPSQNAAPLVKGQGNYDADLKTVMKVLDLLREPVAALRAKEPVDREFAATLLVQKYRTYPQTTIGGAVKQEPVSAEESKLVLKALAEMDWNKFDVYGQSRLQQAFNQLGATDRDGWKPPAVAAGQDYNAVLSEAVKKWLADHADTFKLQRYVVGTPASKK